MSTEDNIATIRRAFEAINRGNVEGFMSGFAPTCIFHDKPSGGITTYEGARQGAVSSFKNFPDLYITLEDMIVQGEKVVVRYTYSATHPPTGKKVTWTGISILHFVDGKVVEDWANTDMLSFMQQIAAIPT